MRKYCLIATSFLSILHAQVPLQVPVKTVQECQVPKRVMRALLLTESHAKKPFYPFIIRYNSSDKKTIAKVRKVALYFNQEHLSISEPVIDCYSQKNCAQLASFLIQNRVTNLDLGAYQINYYHHPDKNLESYFDKEKAFIKACNYLHKLINAYGYSWNSIAKYHSFTRVHHKRYLKKLVKNYQTLQ